MDSAIASVRRFNRAVTRRVGALDDRFLGRDRPLNECRVIFEIGADGSDIRDLRDRLDFDSGYMSRLLRALEKEGLVRVGPGRTDRRVRRARLTASGKRELTEIDDRSEAFAASILRPLSPPQRDRLVTAMTEVERLLTIPFTLIRPVEPDMPDALFCLEQYHAELAERFEQGYDHAAHPVPPREEMMPPRGVFLIATVDSRPIGCGALSTLAPGVGFITRMWVDSSVRGVGLGSRILNELESQAVELGHRRVRLDTNRALDEARAMYLKHGYREVEPFSHHPYSQIWFEKKLP